MKKMIFLFVCFLCTAAQKVEFSATWNVKTDALNAIIHEVGLELAPLAPDRLGKKELFSRFDKDVSKVIFWNLTNEQWKQGLDRIPKAKLVLFMWEPPTFLPKMYRKKRHEPFSRIYTWDDDLVDNQKYFKFHYPELQPMQSDLPTFEEKKLCAMVVGKHKSKHPNELYTKREKAITFFANKPKGEFAFFGRGWEKKLPNYKGPVDDKIACIKNFRFSICFENISGLNGYITEKIFDCFAAGNVPIYLGAKNVTDYIPENCFIDMRKFSSFEELYQMIKSMPEDVYENYLKNIRKFLDSEEAQVFSKESFNKIFLEAATAKK